MALRRATVARGCTLASAVALLCGCRAMPVTVDDGRRIDDGQLAAIRAYGEARQLLQEAVVRSAPAAASACETDWELPFAAATSEDLPVAERVAWLRALQVDERATVVAATADSGLAPGDRLVEIGGYRGDGGQRMIEALAQRRDSGRPFEVKTASGRRVQVAPLRVCRGRAQVAAPARPAAQDYHWTYSVHPHEVFQAGLTRDEALWLVLWTQGLAAEGGARMMGYQYGVVPLRAVLGVAALVSGAGAVARAAQTAGPAAAGEVGAVVAKNVATGVAVGVAKDQMETAISASSRNRAGLEGVAWVAGTMFDQADRWCFERMTALGADPLAGLTLHRKLAAAGKARNAFVLDAERLPSMLALAERSDLGAQAKLALEGAAEPADPATDALADWEAEPMPQADETGLAMAAAADLLLEPVAAMPMEASR